jgi:hypothetical protein
MWVDLCSSCKEAALARISMLDVDSGDLALFRRKTRLELDFSAMRCYRKGIVIIEKHEDDTVLADGQEFREIRVAREGLSRSERLVEGYGVEYRALYRTLFPVMKHIEARSPYVNRV